jgi:hypothetical protein
MTAPGNTTKYSPKVPNTGNHKQRKIPAPYNAPKRDLWNNFNLFPIRLDPYDI